jgi:hypothetical protein
VKKVFLCCVTVALAIFALPNSAAAISCPVAPNPGDNVYTVTGTVTTTATQCVFEYGAGNLDGASNDDFLNGPNDNGTSPYFGGGFTSFCSTIDAIPPSGSGNCDDLYGFTFTSSGGSGTWSFNGVLGTTYVLGVKDGSDPFWAAFLLSNTDPTNPVFYSGTWSIVGGGLSHFVIYDRGGGGPEGQTPVPEPASLVLLGTGLAVVARKVRRTPRA